MLGINFLPGTKWFCVRDIYFSSIQRIFSATCSDGDMVVVFGCEMDLFSYQHLRR